MSDTEVSRGRPGAREAGAREVRSVWSRSGSTTSDPRGLNDGDDDDDDDVASLKRKLTKATGSQTTAEEALSVATQDLAVSKARVAYLEAEAHSHAQKISKGQLFTRKDMDKQKAKLAAETEEERKEKIKLIAQLEEERKQKAVVQQEKRGIERELETLTASLFEEANKMVATANRERDAMERRNSQLRDQIKDTEMLLASQHEQLTELKSVMQEMGTERLRDDTESTGDSDEPSSPASRREDNTIARLLEAMNLSPTTPEMGEIPPAPSTKFAHLLKAVCRIDIPAYDDFRHFVTTAFRSQPPSRVTSGSYNGVNIASIGSLANSRSPAPASAGSTTSLNSPPSLTNSPAQPGSSSPLTDTKAPAILKESKIFKRLLLEDIEPTLRLDQSPSISWLSRRSIISALAEGTLIVEPIPDNEYSLYGRLTHCAMCGEARNHEKNPNPRTHRMRLSEDHNATRWALCVLCLEKARGVCELAGFLRMVRDGVIKCIDREEEREAWEELVRLRERLFWARMAGGVVPAFMPNKEAVTDVADDAGLSQENLNFTKYMRRDTLGAETTSPNSSSPPITRLNSAEVWGGGGEKSPAEAERQLRIGNLSKNLTTFDSINPLKRSSDTPAAGGAQKPQSAAISPQAKRTSSISTGFLKVNIPSSFWGGEVNVLR